MIDTTGYKPRDLLRSSNVPLQVQLKLIGCINKGIKQTILLYDLYLATNLNAPSDYVCIKYTIKRDTDSCSCSCI